jgi:GNAT superfamily N-acetyltransferase
MQTTKRLKFEVLMSRRRFGTRGAAAYRRRIAKDPRVEPPCIRLRVLTSDDWRLFREVRLAALREAAYAFGSTLADWQGPHDAEERWRQRLSNVPLNVVAYFNEAPAGMVGATSPDAAGTSELISMWVAPHARGKGVADALVAAVVAWATERGINSIELDVVEANPRARAFYRRCGFVDRVRVADPRSAQPERRMVWSK